jgi:uncharacterized protein YigA (DUF484 family)
MTVKSEAKSDNAEAGETPRTGLQPEAVADYLQANPAFFDHHPEALAHLRLQHESGQASSLIERQVHVLRAQYDESEHRLDTLLTAARDNEARVVHLNTLAQCLIRADSLDAVARNVRDSLSDSFQVDGVFLGLLGEAPEGTAPGAMRWIAPGDELREVFRDFFRTGKAECGPLAVEKAAALFPEAATDLQSAALIPLDRATNLGMLVLVSREPERFTPAMGTWFLELAAQLVATACRAHMPPGE